MRDDVKVEMPNRTPKTLIPFDGIINQDGVLKSSGKLEGDHAMHFLSWIERCIAHSSLYKCSHANDTIEGGPTM